MDIYEVQQRISEMAVLAGVESEVAADEIDRLATLTARAFGLPDAEHLNTGGW